MATFAGAVATEEVVIAPQFNGPPHSANGGYAAGLVAERVGPAAEVRLHRPPPLGVPLTRRRSADGTVELLRGDALVATGIAGRPDVDVPAAPDVATAVAASAGYRGHDPDQHPWPSCYVCGPHRDDGLRVFAGPLGSGPVIAGTWNPRREHAYRSVVMPRFVWAALDCPSGFATMPPGEQVVLASMTLALRTTVLAGRPHVVTAWPLGSEGRKHRAAAALHDARGRLVASATALWITLDRPLEVDA